MRGIRALLARDADLRAEVLVLPHHGSRTSLSPALYARVSPDAALCSDGFLNRYDFPHPEVVEAVGAPVAVHGPERPGGRGLGQWRQPGHAPPSFLERLATKSLLG